MTWKSRGEPYNLVRGGRDRRYITYPSRSTTPRTRTRTAGMNTHKTRLRATRLFLETIIVLKSAGAGFTEGATGLRNSGDGRLLRGQYTTIGAICKS